MTAESNALHEIQLDEKTAIRRLVDFLQKGYPAEVTRVVLFGSKARGDFQADSDIDLLVLVQHENWSLRNAIWSLAAAIELDYDNVIFNIQVIGVERWGQMSQAHFSLCQSVEQDGIVLSSR